jgi:hypothetical protein
MRRVITAVRKSARTIREITTGRRRDFFDFAVWSFMGLKLAHELTYCKLAVFGLRK